jgi:GT2 family glycosyltransferase/SAM-dependent methyltransferase/ribosomal protein S18 acetylase RimI-like enzyme
MATERTGETPFFSIIVPTYGRPDQLGACLNSLSSLEYPRDRFEVIVVDDGSPTPPADLVARFHNILNVKLLVHPHAGPGAARNMGAAHAHGEFLAFTDDDCMPDANWLRALAARFVTASECAIGGRTLNMLAHNPFSSASQAILNFVYAYYNTNPERASFFATNNLALPARQFHALNGFDTKFLTSEDRDFCDRWVSQGFRMGFAPEAVVYHSHQLTLRSFLRQHFNYGRGAFRFHQARALRGSGSFEIDLSFYRKLLQNWLRGTSRENAPVTTFVIWQIANVAGFMWEGAASRIKRFPRLARAVDVLRNEGWRSLWFRALGETIYRRLVVIERRLDKPFPPVTTSVPVGVRPLAAFEIDEYVRFRPDANSDEIRRRLLAGHRCFVARYQGGIVNAGWYGTGRVRIDYLDRDIVLAPNEAYQYDSFTLPAFRGCNIAAFRIREAAAYFRAAGYRRLLAVVLPENRAAFRPVQKSGYNRAGVMGYVGLARWRRHFYLRNRPAPNLPSEYWDEVMAKNGATLDQWRAYMQRVYKKLIQQWLQGGDGGPGLKTDLFEEAVSARNLLPTLGPGSIGLDCSPAIAAAARQQLNGNGGRYPLVVADLRAIPLQDDSVSHILAGSSLDHFTNKADIAVSLKELARVLRPGGTLIITFDNPHNPVVRMRNAVPFTWLNRLGLVPYYVGETFTREEACAQLERAGLTVTDVKAVAHAVRAPAIWLVTLLERLNSTGLQRRLASLLDTFERLERWPTQYLTGYYVALRAEKRGSVEPSAGKEFSAAFRGRA